MTGEPSIDEVIGPIRVPAPPASEPWAEAPVTAWLTRFGVPGVSVALIRDGVLAWTGAAGVRDADTGEPVTPETPFLAGSISKPVAALAALRLVARGELDLDADVNERLRSWRVPPISGWQPRITLRQLLSHTAGLTVHGFPGYGPREAVPSLVDVLDGNGNTPPVRVASVPGLQFSYSGGGYCVLQQLLIDVTGSPFPALARELVLDPLGMTASTYEQPPPAGWATHAASGHRAGGSVVAGGWTVYPEMAAAGLWTTAADLCRFAVGVQRAAAGDESILPRALVDDLLTAQSGNALVGLGLFLEGSGPGRRFGHGGTDEGFQAHLSAGVETGLGVAILTNGDHGRPIIEAILEAVTAGWPALEPAAVTGTYRLPDGRTLTVRQVDRGLEVAWPGQGPMPLEQRGTGYAVGGLDATLTPEIEGDVVRRLRLRQEAQYTRDVVAERVPG